MKNIDYNEFASDVFSGLMVGILLGGWAGNNFMWLGIGAFVGAGASATKHIREQRKNAKRGNPNNLQ